MKRLLSASVAVLVAFSIAIPTADAQQVKRKRLSFFEMLFGTSETRARQRAERQRKLERRRAAQDWWDYDFEDDVRFIYGNGNKNKRKIKKRAAAKAATGSARKLIVPVKATAFIDPEIAQGIGMGNLVYQSPKLSAVYDKGLSKLQGVGTDAQAIRVVLIDKSTSIRATAELRSAVLKFYEANRFKPLWIKDGKPTERALAVLEVLAQSASEGLEPARYLPPVLRSFANATEQVADDSLAAAELDVGLTVMAATFAQHMSGGAFDPKLLSGYHDLKPQSVSPDVALRVLAYSPFPADYLKGLAPKHPAYAAFKAELAKLDDPAAAIERFADGPRVRVGRKDDRIPQLRKRLAREGYLTEAIIEAGREEYLDEALSGALKEFQQAKGLAKTGALDAATIKALNGPETDEVRDLLVTNMERLRWLPDDLGSKHVFVNQPAYKVDLIENGKSIWTSRVIVGKPMNQTAVFSDTMETVVFNPSWGIPKSIIVNEYLPKLRSNPSYLDKKGYVVLNEKGKVVKSRSVNWHGVGTDSQISILQPPGEDNALGEIKFLFPNNHAIYMHDTPNRHLFEEDRRAYSHGCVRVQNPREFAQFLLKWSPEQVDAEINGKLSKSVPVPEKIRVHLTYFTAWPDETGKIQYYSDVYERDRTLKQARATVAKALGLHKLQRVVENPTVKSTMVE